MFDLVFDWYMGPTDFSILKTYDENLEESIFDVDIGEFGVCQEPFQGKQRATVTVGGGINMMNDERWASAVSKKYGSKLPRDDEGYLKAFNAGMTILTREGIQKAKHTWGAIQEYINYIRNKGIPRFYTYDQNYIIYMFQGCFCLCNTVHSIASL